MLRIIGQTIILLAFIGSINPYFVIFTAPAFIVGVVILWFSKLEQKLKWLWTILPLILWIPSMFLAFKISDIVSEYTAQKLDFIFEEDFEGSVVIVANQPCGQEVMIGVDRELLYIPTNGILLYRGELESGRVDHRYFIKTNKDSLIRLPERSSYMYYENIGTFPPAEKLGVWFETIGSSYSGLPKPEIRYQFMRLTVSSQDSIKNYSDFNFKNEFDNQVDSLVRICQSVN